MASMTLKDQRFWDRIADKYSKRPVQDEDVYQRKLAITRDYLRPDHRVFEFGCGTGSTALVHAPHVAQVDATDLSPRMIGIAQDKARAAGINNVSFRAAPFPEAGQDGGFDVVLGLNVLHLVPDLDATVTAAAALLKPGGVFVSSTPCLGDMLPVFRFIGPIGRALGKLPYINVFRRGDLDRALANAGLTIEQDWQPGKRTGVFIVARKA